MNCQNHLIIYIWIAISSSSCTIIKQNTMKQASSYEVIKLNEPITIDGIWDKSQWKAVDAIELKHYMGKIPEFRPGVKVKVIYDPDYIYVIFQVKDQYVLCVNNEINGNVYEDSCGEFFFSPDTASPMKYFNLEINCGGTALMYYNLIPRKDFKIMDPEDIKLIQIAHSLPQLISDEIKAPVIWAIEYKIPLTLLEKYGKVTRPAPGVIWKANFYKIADKTSNPHYLTWSLVDQAEPDFHLPAFFGKLIFQ